MKEEDVEKVQKQIPEIATDETVMKLDHFERNAVHVACANKNTSMETMNILLEMYPDALMEQDKGGRLPFHIAIAHQTDRRFLQYLIDHYPDCMFEKTKFGVRHFKSFFCLGGGSLLSSLFALTNLTHFISSISSQIRY